jgi:hypothetical protein
MVNGKLHTLIPLDDFKAVMGIDDREDRLARFCLVTSTCAIEQYCKRKLLRKRHFEIMNNENILFMLLREYPVSEILAVYAIGNEEFGMSNGELIEPDFYRVVPDCGTDEDIPFSMEMSPAIARMGYKAVKAIYMAGYTTKEKRKEKKDERGVYVPADLAAACLELASWNMNRYRGRRIGMTGNIRGEGKEGEHFEMSMPEQVRLLLEPYKRRVI